MGDTWRRIAIPLVAHHMALLFMEVIPARAARVTEVGTVAARRGPIPARAVTVTARRGPIPARVARVTEVVTVTARRGPIPARVVRVTEVVTVTARRGPIPARAVLSTDQAVTVTARRDPGWRVFCRKRRKQAAAKVNQLCFR